MNLDGIVELIIRKIRYFLREQGIYNFNANQLLSTIQNQYRPLYDILIGDLGLYNDVFSSFCKDVYQLNKPIIIILDDIDRITNIDDIKKVFYICEKLSGSSNGNLKFIIQYNSLELNRKGLDSLYLQKYIPNNIKLTPLSFTNIVDKIIGSDPQKYVFSSKNRFLFDKLLLNITSNEYGGVKRNDINNHDILDSKDIAEYFNDFVNIRSVKYFLEEIELLAFSRLNEKEERKELKEALILSCFIKYFIPEVYNSISSDISLIDNLKILVEDKWI